MRGFHAQRLISGAVFLLVFGGCGLSSILTPTSTDSATVFDELAATAAMQLTLTVPNPGEEQATDAIITQPPCAYTWDIRPLPDETILAQKALDEVGLSNVTIIVVAYGENCIVTQTNEVRGFTILETDFQITITVGNNDDEREKGRLLSGVLKAIIALPEDTFPGSQAGMVKVRFVSGENEENIQFQLDVAKTGLARGLENEALLQVLR